MNEYGSSNTFKIILKKFIPLLILYILIIIIFSKNELTGDEVRYVGYAENLLNGFYTNPENPKIDNGPAYPIILTVFVGLKLPMIIAKLVNALFVFMAIIFFFKMSRLFVSEKMAIILAYILGFYYPMFRWLPHIITESLTLLLLCGFMYFTMKSLRSDKFNFKGIIFSGLFLGVLILTKFVFAYVTLASFIFIVLYLIIDRGLKSTTYAMILGLGLLTTIPYLTYTYSLTGRIFYWGTNTGDRLYWMSSRQENEYGNWINADDVLRRNIEGMDRKHIVFHDSIFDSRSVVERNDLFSKVAKSNIRKNPMHYILNVISNTSRLLFNFPRSYSYQNMGMTFFLIIHTLLLYPVFFSLYPAWKNRKYIPIEIYLLLLFILIYIGGSVLTSTVARFFFPVVPFILLWLGFVFENIVNVKLTIKNQ